MATDASTDLTDALALSLADANADWSVASAQTTKTPRLTGVSGSVVTGTGTITSSSTTRDELTAVLKSGAVRLLPGSSELAQFRYRSIIDGSTFVEAFIYWGGAELRHTDEDLDDQIRVLVDAFLAERDADITAALEADPSAPAGTLPMDVDLLAGLVASLSDVDAAWAATARVENSSDTERTVTINMLSMVARFAVGSPVPAQFVWIGRYDLFGDLIEARVFFAGAEWRTSDAALEAAVRGYGDSFLAAKEAAIIAAL